MQGREEEKKKEERLKIGFSEVHHLLSKQSEGILQAG